MRRSLHPSPRFASVALVLLAACESRPAETPASVTAVATKSSPALSTADTPCSRTSSTAPSIATVSLRGTTEADACMVLQSRAGALLDDATIETDIRALHATGLFADVTAVLEDAAGAPHVLVFEVRERPRVANVAVRGAPEGFDARETVGTQPRRHDPVWTRSTRERLQEALRGAGYRKAVVEHEVAPSGDGAVAVSFVITPGPRVVLGAVRFEGLTTAPLERVRAGLALTPGEPAPELWIERDTLIVQSALYELGLVESQVKTRIEENFLASRFDVIFTVIEGPAYRLGEVKVSGSKLLPKGRYEKILATLPRGSLFVRSKIATVVQTVERMHHDDGTDRRVDVRTTLDPKRHLIDVDMHVE